MAVASPSVIPERFRPVIERTRPLAERFDAAGQRIYLVGGLVRDMVLGRPVDENDARRSSLPFDV